MINWIVTSSVLILVVIGLRFSLHGKISPRLQYALWLVVLFRLLVPFDLGTTGLSLMNVVDRVPVVQEMDSVRNIEEIQQLKTGQVRIQYNTESQPGVPVTEIVDMTEESYRQQKRTLNYHKITMGVWTAGMAVMFAVFIITNFRLHRMLKKDRRPLSTDLTSLPVYVTGAVETPCLFGDLKPAIYVTPEVAENENILRHTIIHEIMHYQQHDLYRGILRCVALSLHWYNPLVWWAAKLSKDDAELACDDAVIQKLGEEERYAYGKTLIEMTKPGRNALLGMATTMTGSKSSLKERIERIAKQPKMAVYTLIAVIVIVAVAVVCTMTGAENHKFEEWLQSVKADEIGESYVGWDIGVHPKSQVLSEEDLTELCRLLNQIDRSQLRKETSSGGHDSYILIVPWSDEDGRQECLFKVQDDTSVSVTFDYETGIKMIEEGKYWHIQSPELVKFIEECAMADTIDAEGKTIEKTELVRADVDKDGIDETIYVEEYLHSVYRLTVEEAGGSVIWEVAHLSTSHPGWETYLLYEKDGQTAMVRYSPYVSTGIASYIYQIFTLENGTENILQENGVSFELGKPETYPAELEDYIREVNGILDDCTVIFSTEQGEVMTGPASPAKFQNANKALLMESIDTSLLAGQDLSEAAVNFAKDYVQTQIDHHYEIGNVIAAARITALEPVSTGTAALNWGLCMYRLEYRLLPENPDQVVLAGGMSMDGEEITERGSTGQPYILLSYLHGADGTIWTRLAVTNTDSIEFDYGTPEMVQEYGNAYTAAAMELWNEFYYSLKNEEAVDAADPAAAVVNLFDYSDDVFLGLQFTDEGTYNSYIVEGWEYREDILSLLDSFQWSSLKDYDASASYGVTITSGDGRRQLIFWSDDVVEYRSAGESFFWKSKALQQDVSSMANIMQAKYYAVDASAERIRFYTGGSAEDAAKSFVHSVFGSHLLNLAWGSDYGVSAYEVVDWEVFEVTEEDDAVCGGFNYAFVPLVENSINIWAGNTSVGTGAYDEMLVCYREFVLTKQPDGYWLCTGFGTGGYRWGQADSAVENQDFL